MSVNDQFDGRYLRALRCQLGPSPGPDGAEEKALGRAALAEKIGGPGIVRSHARALRAIAPPPAGAPASRRHAEAFLLGVMTSFERAQRADTRGAGAAVLRRTAAELVRAKAALGAERARALRTKSVHVEAERGRRAQLVQSRTVQEQLRRITRRALAAQEEERMLVSRKLHGDVAQVLTGINVQLAILNQASTVNGRSVRQRIAHAQRFVAKSVTAVYRVARDLRPALLDDLGLVPALRSLIRTLPVPATLRIRLVSTGGREALDNAARTVLFRVAQEALGNVARHAHATQATVRLDRSSQGVALTIDDDGRAFDVARVLSVQTQKHLGLVGMRERVEMAGGSLVIESTPNKGTTVRAFIPLPPETRGLLP